jgi:M6 family metalloprotease-like protein
VDAAGSIPDGNISSFHNEGPPEIVTATNWRTNWAGAVDTGTTAASGVTVSFSLEHLRSSGGGNVRIRAVRPDGTVFDPPEYVLDTEPSFSTQTMLFATKDFPKAGLQFYEIQYKVDDGVTAQFRDYSIASGAVRRTGADFAQAQPYQNNLHPRQGAFDVLTICLDPLRPGQPAITNDTVMRFIDGSDGGINVRELVSEMSGQRWRLGAHSILGCGTPGFYQPPVEHQGNWYWDNGAFDVMRKDAITAADADFDFKSFDLDDNDAITSDELHINICIPQTSAGGAARGGVFQVDGTTLAMRVIDCYFGPNSSRRPAVGINAHEAAHWMLNAYDLYGPDIPPMPDDLSLMGTALPIHLSAYEKLHHGWIMASVLDISQWNPPPAPSDVALPQSVSQTVMVDPIETSKWTLLIYDPTRSSDEYFLIEHRSKSSDLGITNYDRYLSVTVPAGPVLWHIVENPALLNPSIPPPVPCRPAWPLATSGCVDPTLWADRLAMHGWVVGGIQNWGSIVPDQAIPLVWSDGTPVNITVSGVSGDSSLVTITKELPPLPVAWP